MKSFVLFCVAACGAANPASAPASDGRAHYAKKVLVEWSAQATEDGKHTDVYLQTTDEIGQQVSYSVGVYDGQCHPFKPAPEMGAASGVTCAVGAGAVELQAVIRDEDIIVLRLNTDATHPADPMARVEVTRVKIPRGTGIHD